jgi:protein SCO1/2
VTGGLSRRALGPLLLAALAAPTVARAHDVAALPKPGNAPDPLAGRFGGPFTLTAHDGRRVSDTDFRGRFLIVYFGYTSCIDLCPLDLALMSEALDGLGAAAERVQPLFITVDPAFDTPAVLAAYVKAFHPRLIGLTGSEAEIAAVAKAYRVHRRKLQPGPAIEARYLIDHGSLTYLMRPDGSFATLIPHGATAEAMTKTLSTYLAAA